MGELLRIDQVVNRRIDQELAKAKLRLGARYLEIMTLEDKRGDTMGDRDLLRALRRRALPRIG